MTQTDWLKLWSELVSFNYQPRDENKTLRYTAHARKKSERPDPLLDYVLSQVYRNDTAIEIGPGSGRWTIPLAHKVKMVTEIEPSAEMAEILSQNIASAGLNNVIILPEIWEKAEPGRHDICVCAHAMYNSPDLASFVRKMETQAEKLCALSIRIPPADGVMAELAEVIYGRRHDSPDAIIAFNALYSLGISTNVLIEPGILNWVNRDMAEAFIRAKRHLRLEKNSQFDDIIRNVLNSKLRLIDGNYRWPDGMRSALLYFQPGKNV